MAPTRRRIRARIEVAAAYRVLMDSCWATFASRLADCARAETLSRWRSGCAVENKAGPGSFDPVTDADREAERAMRALIEQEQPDHGILGEELGEKASRGDLCWVLDPVDGTRSFTCGLPTWVTLIALLDRGAPTFGLIDAPCLDERYYGSPDQSWLEERGRTTRLATSRCTAVGEARLSSTDPGLFSGAGAQAFARLTAQTRTVRYGHDGYAYARLAAGTLDLVVETGLQRHDYCALIPVVRGAGGAFGDWRGGEDFSSGRVIAAATPELYRAAVAVMRDAA